MNDETKWSPSGIEAKTAALNWLLVRGGKGVLVVEKSSWTVWSNGEKSPFMNTTWNALVADGKIKCASVNHKTELHVVNKDEMPW